MPIPAPLFRDPIYDGAADPTIIWNREAKTGWQLYTHRRANVAGPGRKASAIIWYDRQEDYQESPV